MNEISLVRVYHPASGVRLGVRVGDDVVDLTDQYPTPGAWLRASAGGVDAAIADLAARAGESRSRFPAADFDNPPGADRPHWLAPVEEQEVWAAGVTYERSRDARQEEAIDGGDIYSRVYNAQRPELFFKAPGWRVVGPGGEVGIRADAQWSVPEPELAVLATPALEVAGFTVGNDMSSRDIEGQNPLYLPQAKVYTASCALGPGVVLRTAAQWPDAVVRMSITRGGQTAFVGEVHTSRLRRRVDELLGYLGRSITFPAGVVLLTGTGIVPPADFTLAAGDQVTISIEGIGTLANTVRVV